MGEACDLTDCQCEPLVGGGRPFALIGAQSDAELTAVFESSVVMPVAPDAAYTAVPEVHGGVILVGDYVMLGVNARGNLNTRVTSNPLILGFDAAGAGVPVALPTMTGGYPNNSSGFAFRTGPTEPFREDVMTPGCLCEGWGVRFVDGGTTVSGDAAIDGAAFSNSAVGTFFGYFYDAFRRAWRVRTRATVGDLEVTMDYSLRRGDRYAPERILLRNTGADDITNLRYLRSLDYDIAIGRPGGDGFTDQFDFLYTPADATPQLIRSRELTSGAPATDDYYGVATASPHLECSDGITFMQTNPDSLGDCDVDPNNTNGDLTSNLRFVPTLAGFPAWTLPAGMSVAL